MVQIQKNLGTFGRRFIPAALDATWMSIGLVCGVIIACIVLLAAGVAAVVIAEHFAVITYSTEVQVAGGALRGRERTTPAGVVYLSFQGIPYAAPPLGPLRFKAPQPAEPWAGVRDVLSEGGICPQPHKVSKTSPIKSMGSMLKMVLSMPGMAKFMFSYIARMSEDCLFLNVYTPQTVLPAEKLKPVVVFIHGGGFIAGNGDMSLYGPDYLVELDVVVVTINYRLGAFGFLTTNSSDAPGNAGLKDQVMALRWVRDNIRMFGGDPESVTLYGESAGSISVTFHMMSASSRGLFHRAILSSGTAQNQYALTANYDRFSRRLAEECGADKATAADPEQRLRFLREVSHTLIDDRLPEVLGDDDVRSIMGCMPFVPVVETEFPGGEDEVFLSEHPDHLVREGRYAQVPVIIGTNSKEGSIFYTGVTRPPSEEGFRMIDDDMTCTIPDPLYRRLDPGKRSELAEKIRQLYFKGGHVSENTSAALIDLFGDLQLEHGIHVTTKWFAHYSSAKNPMYIYHFTLPSKNGLSFFFSSRNLKGAGHGEEMSYVFRHHLFKSHPNLKQNAREQGVRDKMTKLFTNFIKTGNPTPSNATLAGAHDVGVTWPAVRPGRMQYLEIGEQLVVKKDLLKERMSFWDRLYRDILGTPLYDYFSDRK